MNPADLHPFDVPARATDLLAEVGLAGRQPAPATSTEAFPDGGRWRLEIPSVEGPAALAAVIETAERLDVPVHRVSQGSGVSMLTDGEIADMVSMAGERSMVVCLFLTPRASWDIGAQRSSAVGNLVARARGRDAVLACIDEALRACELGVRSLLVADEGVLWVLHQLREQGRLPADLQLKLSVQAAPGNPASFALLHQLGADTINVPSDLSLTQLAELRDASDATVDFYVEAPDGVGGFVRHHDVAEIVRVAAPVYLKFGLRNAPDIYPSGQHLHGQVVSSALERVRRARLGLDLLDRQVGRAAREATMSPVTAAEQPRTRTLALLTDAEPAGA